MPVAQTRNTHLRNSNRSVDSCMRPRSFDQYHQDRQALAVQGGRSARGSCAPSRLAGGGSQANAWWVGTAGAMAERAGRNQLSPDSPNFILHLQRFPPTSLTARPLSNKWEGALTAPSTPSPRPPSLPGSSRRSGSAQSRVRSLFARQTAAGWIARDRPGDDGWVRWRRRASLRPTKTGPKPAARWQARARLKPEAASYAAQVALASAPILNSPGFVSAAMMIERLTVMRSPLLIHSACSDP